MENTVKHKILYVITKSNWGGAGRYVYDMATHLPKEEFEPVVALGGSGLLREKLENAGIRTIEIKGMGRDVRLFGEILAFFAILKIVRNEKPSAIHLNSSKAGALGALAARVMGIEHIIFTAHGWAFKENRPLWQKKLIEFISWLTLFLSHITIVVSKDDKDKIKDFLLVSKKIKIIHNGIHPLPAVSREEARKILIENSKQEETSPLWIGTIAELHKNKGLEYALRGYADFIRSETTTQTTLVIIGEGEERKNLEKIIAEELLTNHVILAGEKEEAARLLGAFDIFFLSSVKEGLPYVLLEAGMAKLPVIATAVGGIPEIVEDMKSGIVVRPKEPKQLQEAFHFLTENAEKRSLFGEKLHEKVAKEFTIEKMVAETITLYRGTQS
jgi:glycosyltransferase involved in cell wall biosynthesis